jgi:hypothetical protein
VRRVFPSRRAPLTPLARLAFSSDVIGANHLELWLLPRLASRHGSCSPALPDMASDATCRGSKGRRDWVLRGIHSIPMRHCVHRSWEQTGAKEQIPIGRLRCVSEAKQEEGRVACGHETAASGERLRAATRRRRQDTHAVHGSISWRRWLPSKVGLEAPANGWFLEAAKNKVRFRS